MTTRKELIEQARADQRSRSARARADNPKSAIVGIGDRDPLTGQYQVMLPDGSVEMGEKQFNSSLPKGSQVLGVPSTGGWLLDERDVQPIKPTLQPSPSGKIKVLFSKIEGAERVFYVWGDRPKPKRIGSIPAVARLIDDVPWTIDNRGTGDRYIANVKWQEQSPAGDLEFDAGATHTQAFGDQNWDFINPRKTLAFKYREACLGHGFWTDVKYQKILNVGEVAFPTVLQPTSYSLYKGVARSHAASRVETYNTDSFGQLRLSGQTTNIDTAILPELLRSYFFTESGFVGSQRLIFPLLISKDEKTAIYRETFQDDSAFSFTAQTKLATASSEIVLGGALPSAFNATDFSNGILIDDRFFVVNPVILTPQTQWEVEVYKLGTSSTKRSIKAKVIYKHTPDKRFHSASYHP